MKKKIIFILFFLIPIVMALEPDLNSKEMYINLDISSTIDVMGADYVSAELSLVPRDNPNQKITNLITEPLAVFNEDRLLYKWINPNDNLKFGLSSSIITKNSVVEIREKIPFPLNVHEEYIKYTKPTENIDINQDIIELSSKIAEGEDDSYVVVDKIAEWIENNIKYDLNTLTAEVSQKSSWVLENRYGVCDEISSLFISMLRSLGIPAKFISGIAYTNWNDINDFGNHAWVEVYFPDYGWVPYDLTYGQLAYIDPTHIKLKEGTDSDESSTKYIWKNGEIKTKGLDIKASITKQEDKINDIIELNANALKKNIGFDSYNLIEAEIKNLNDFYIVTTLDISRTEELENLDEKKIVLLKPNEIKKEYWRVKLKSLEKGYKYTFPITIFSERNLTAETSFDSEDGEAFYSLDDVNEIIEENKKTEKKKLSKNIELKCNIDKGSFYYYESALVNCDIKNIGNVLLKELDICLNECKKIDLGISQSKQIDFNFSTDKIGKQEIEIKAENNDISQFNFLKVEVFDEPKIVIENIKTLDKVEYNQPYEISFDLNKSSYSNPLNVELILKQNHFTEKWDIKELFDSQAFKINLNGNELSPGINNFEIKTTYHDKEKKEFTEVKKFEIELVNVRFSQRIIIFFKNIGRYVMEAVK